MLQIFDEFGRTNTGSAT